MINHIGLPAHFRCHRRELLMEQIDGLLMVVVVVVRVVRNVVYRISSLKSCDCVLQSKEKG